MVLLPLDTKKVKANIILVMQAIQGQDMALKGLLPKTLNGNKTLFL